MRDRASGGGYRESAVRRQVKAQYDEGALTGGKYKCSYTREWHKAERSIFQYLTIRFIKSNNPFH